MPDNEELFQGALDALREQAKQAMEKHECYLQQCRDNQTTWGQLKAQMADVSDDTPLMVLYDGQAGCSITIERDCWTEAVDWAHPNTVYLDISKGQG